MKKISEYLDNDIDIDLRNNFAKAMGKDGFNRFVSRLNVGEDKLIANTTKIESVICDIENCTNCDGLSSCKNATKGYYYYPRVENNNIDFVYKACKYMIKYNKDREHFKNIFVFDIPDEVRNARLKNVYKDDKNRLELIKGVKGFYDQYLVDKHIKGFYLHGSFGSGKTYIVSALFNELAKHEVKSAIVYFPEFLRSLKGTFGGNYDYNETFEYIKKIPLLLLDDIGAEKVSEWGRDEVLGSILQYRMDSKLPTFFTSNLDIDELYKHLSMAQNSVDLVKARRIIERIKYLTNDVSLVGVNRRDC